MLEVRVDIMLFLAATFLGGFVAGLSGFAFGLVAASVWLYILTPLQAATLIVAFGLIVQAYSVWHLRSRLKLRALWPFLAGGLFGVPLGVAVLTWANPVHVQAAIGVLLVSYSLYALWRPSMPPVTAGGALLDAGVGFLNGVVAGISGLAGILVTVWCGLRGCTKDEQRAVFQPVAVATFALTAAWIGARGAITADIVALFALGLPALLAGTWLGTRLYGRLDEVAFRRTVLVLLLLSGAVLIIR